MTGSLANMEPVHKTSGLFVLFNFTQLTSSRVIYFRRARAVTPRIALPPSPFSHRVPDTCIPCACRANATRSAWGLCASCISVSLCSLYFGGSTSALSKSEPHFGRRKQAFIFVRSSPSALVENGSCVPVHRTNGCRRDSRGKVNTRRPSLFKIARASTFPPWTRWANQSDLRSPSSE